MGKTIIPKLIAQELRCDVKKVRRWLRRRYPQLVSKAHWEFNEQEARRLVRWIRQEMRHEPTRKATEVEAL